jgi:O-antigen/teichoic acid export membrane protein
MSLKEKTIKGLIWTFTQQFGGQMISFIVSTVLARLLLPSEFGLIAMLSLFIALGSALMDSGITSSLIRTENPTQNDYSSVFYLNIITGICIYIILFLTAPVIAAYYRSPLLTSILRAYSIIFIINSFVGVQATVLTKHMNFKTQLFIQIPAIIISGVTAIILAYNGFGVWSLVYMNIVQSIIVAMLHWVRSDWYPIAIFDKERLQHHFKFGYKLMFSTVLDVSFENIYTIVIGRFFSASQLAFYNRAQSVQMLPVQNISGALHKVTYPLFAQIQNDNTQLKKINKMLMIQVMFWVIPIMLLLQHCAKPLIEFLFTSKWDGAIIYFKILCFYGMLYPMHIYNLNIIIAKGRSDLFFRIEVIKKIFFAVGILFAFQYGIVGLAWWQVIFSVIGFFINSFYSGRLINYPFTEQLVDVSPYFILGFLIWVVIFFVKPLFFTISNNFVQLCLLSCLFMILYFGSAVLLKMHAYKDLTNLIKK